MGFDLLAYVDRANLGVARLHMEGDPGFDDAIIDVRAARCSGELRRRPACAG